MSDETIIYPPYVLPPAPTVHEQQYQTYPPPPVTPAGPGPLGFYPPPYPPPPAPPRKQRRWPWGLAAAVLTLGTIAALIGTNSSSSNPGSGKRDQAFLTVVRSSVPELAARTDSDVIDLGHKTCAALDSGNGVLAVAGTFMSDGGFSAYDAGAFIGASIGAYCPADEALVPSLG